MNDTNLIGINVPNGVSIVIMLAIGGVILGVVRKLVGGKRSNIASGPTFSGG